MILFFQSKALLTVYIVGRKHLQGKAEAGAVPGCPLACWALPVQRLSSAQDEDMEINRGEMLQFPLPLCQVTKHVH